MFLKFRNLQEYENYFLVNKIDITRQIVKSISESSDQNIPEAKICDVMFGENNQLVYEISVDSDEWIPSLESCLKIFLDQNFSDDAIDTYLVKKKLLEKN